VGEYMPKRINVGTHVGSGQLIVVTLSPGTTAYVRADIADDLLAACEAQELGSALQREVCPAPDDRRYTPFIGEWNGYHAPEQRYAEFQQKRRDMRVAAIAKAKGASNG
jgi:molybdopterin-guanine dinucleotide biosynthesis protein A